MSFDHPAKIEQDSIPSSTKMKYRGEMHRSLDNKCNKSALVVLEPNPLNKGGGLLFVIND